MPIAFSFSCLLNTMFKHLLRALHCEISITFVNSSTTSTLIVVGSKDVVVVAGWAATPTPSPRTTPRWRGCGLGAGRCCGGRVTAGRRVTRTASSWASTPVTWSPPPAALGSASNGD